MPVFTLSAETPMQTMMRKSAAIVVTYCPTLKDLENIHTIAGRVQKLYVIDNTPNGARALFSDNNIVVRKCRKNEGLATGLNIGCQLAIEDGFKYMFLLDQDSRPSGSFFSNMLAFQAKTEKRVPDCALIVPDFFDKNSQTFARFPVIRRYRFSHLRCTCGKPIISDHALIAITSGTLISREKYEAIGPFREDYFIDFIDNEYCLRASKKGYRVIVNCGEVLEHCIGKRSTEKWIGITIKPNHHPAPRRYYIARNGIRTALEYGGSYPSFCVLIMARLLHELLSVFIFEKDKIEKLKAIGQGIFHGLVNRMGEKGVV